MDIATDYASVAAGSMIHNYVTSTKGFLGKTLNLGPLNVTQLGALAFAGGILAEKMRWIRQNGFFSDVLKGIFAEGLNAPAVESMARVGAGSSMPGGYPGGAQQPQGTGYSSNMAVTAGPINQVGGPYATPLWWWT
jgi:hypothetical protein